MLEFLANEDKSHESLRSELHQEFSICSSAVKRERQNFLEAFKIEEVWAEMERIQESKRQVNMVYQKSMGYQL